MNAALIYLHSCGCVRRNDLRGEPEAFPGFLGRSAAPDDSSMSSCCSSGVVLLGGPGALRGPGVLGGPVREC